jgi:hypothetical protein
MKFTKLLIFGNDRDLSLDLFRQAKLNIYFNKRTKLIKIASCFVLNSQNGLHELGRQLSSAQLQSIFPILSFTAHLPILQNKKKLLLWGTAFSYICG